MLTYIFEHKKTGKQIELKQSPDAIKAPRGYFKVVTLSGVNNANSGRTMRP